jgi:hypothetical protein
VNVLFWSETYPPSIGGAEVWGSRFVDALIGRGHRVLVVTRTDANHDCRMSEADGAAPIRRFPFSESLTQHDTALLFGIRAVIAELKRGSGPRRPPSSETLLGRVIAEADWVAARSRARIVFPWKACVGSYLKHYSAIQR